MATLADASIIITSFNYGRFLRETIESALNQTHPAREVIVVDDGSQDDSVDIIRSYGGAVTPIIKDNGGQASSINTGFEASRGNVIFFVDSDDALLPTAVEKAVEVFAADVAKVHWPLYEIDDHGERTGELWPPEELPEGVLRELVIREGPHCYANPPTTGNAWARTLLDRILPIPEPTYRICPDSYLCTLAPLYGAIRRVDEPQGLYRVHGKNKYGGRPLGEKVGIELVFFDEACKALARFLREDGVPADPDVWRARSSYHVWMGEVQAALQEIAKVIPPGDRFILVDQDEWRFNEMMSDRHAIPFLERGGLYFGAPADDAEAIREVEQQRRGGSTFLVFGWPAFWWLEYYEGLHDYLRSHFPCVLENDRLIAFDLRQRRSTANSVDDR